MNRKTRLESQKGLIAGARDSVGWGENLPSSPFRPKAKTCPSCNGSIEVTRGERDGPTIIRRAEVLVVHRWSCQQWYKTARKHGGHPEISTVVHEDSEVRITELASPSS